MDKKIQRRVMNNPGLAIKTSSSAVAKFANAFYYVDNVGELTYVAAGDCPALAGGVLATWYTRVCQLQVSKSAWTRSWNYSSDVANDAVKLSDFPQLDDGCDLVWYVIIRNGTGSDFTPATTALDTSSLIVTYINATDAVWGLRL